jgi:hypothetical protein
MLTKVATIVAESRRRTMAVPGGFSFAIDVSSPTAWTAGSPITWLSMHSSEYIDGLARTGTEAARRS